MTTPEYRRGDTVDLSVIHAAFCDGFSDYLVPITMGEEPFEARFFGLECNRRELSFVALVDGTPAGVLLGGVRELHGIRTMRMVHTLCDRGHPRGSAEQMLPELFSWGNLPCPNEIGKMLEALRNHQG